MYSSSLIMVLPWIIKERIPLQGNLESTVFFFKSQQTEENGGADKAACPRVQENAFSGWGGEGGCMPLDLPLGPFVTCHSAMF